MAATLGTVMITVFQKYELNPPSSHVWLKFSRRTDERCQKGLSVTSVGSLSAVETTSTSGYAGMARKNSRIAQRRDGPGVSAGRSVRGAGRLASSRVEA